ncbi:hypothetical protein B0H11DRAFT_2215579 [Mycena galericulata]|nr:hypothetical protein B0H11DRAFT_2215579 [Mycena galericulata]
MSTTNKQKASAFATRPGPFSDATNKTFGIPAEKPVSRRVARQRTKRVNANGALAVPIIKANATTSGPYAETKDKPQDLKAHEDAAAVSVASVQSTEHIPNPPATAAEPYGPPPGIPIPLARHLPHADPTFYTRTSPFSHQYHRHDVPLLRPRFPTLIIRTLPGAPLPKFHGQFEACSRADLLVDPDETRTWEEDVWGVVYGNGGDFAATTAGLVPVITLSGVPGSAGRVQFLYG